MDTNLHIKEAHFVVFDYETLNPYGMPPEPIDLGAAVLGPGLTRNIDRDFNRLIKPPAHVPFTTFATQLTGITAEHVADAPNASIVMRDFNNAFTDESYVFVAHSARYDYGVLKQYVEECDAILQSAFLDTVLLGRHLLPQLRSHRLDALAEYFHIPLPFNRHRGLADSILTADILVKLLELGMEKGIFSLEQLIKIAAIKKPTAIAPKPAQASLFGD